MTNKGDRFVEIDDNDDATPEEHIRGFKHDRLEALEITADRPGEYSVGPDGRLISLT